MVTLAIPKFAIWSMVPVGTAVLTYFLIIKTWRKRFAALAAANFLIGWAVYFLPHANDGGFGGAGFLIIASVSAYDMWQLRKLYKAETDRHLMNTDLGPGGRSDANVG